MPVKENHYPALCQKVAHHLEVIYNDIAAVNDYEVLACQVIDFMGLASDGSNLYVPKAYTNQWTQKEVVLITYGDSVEVFEEAEAEHQAVIRRLEEKPLVSLKHFMDNYCAGVINSVHILPFYPFSSDDGFAVMNYSAVNESLGDWTDIQAISNSYRLMADLVINHCSSRSVWFDNFLSDQDPGKSYFYRASPDDDLSMVVRPRTSPLLKTVLTTAGEQHVWCTFSHDQIDLDFRNPQVLLEFIKIIKIYLDNGVRIFRLDAIAFLWKKIGSHSLNLKETHEVVRLLRTLIESGHPDAIIITETNIPNRENLSYFGNANEAHCVYNFSLPPLLVNTLITGDCHYLKQWMMSMPPAQDGTAYFNFIASHDGIGLRPAEGLLSEDEIHILIRTMQNFGGHVSMRALENGENKPYEINIALFDALKGTVNGEDSLGLERFVCAHAIMFALEGIPGLYIHSLLGTRNDHEKVKHTNHFRAINRHRWDARQLEEELEDKRSSHSQVYWRLRALLALRIEQPAFHPNATQFTMHLGQKLFGFWRQSQNKRQSIFCIYNISDEEVSLSLSDVNLIETHRWKDLISGEVLGDLRGEWCLSPYQSLWISRY